MTINRLLVSLVIIAIFYSCNQNPAVNNPANVDSLLSQGKKYKWAQNDSLPAIAQRLTQLYKSTDNKNALVYAEQFNAEYYWLKSDYKRSMTEAVKSLADAEKWNIKEALPETYLIIGNLHKESGDYKLAFEAQQKGLYWANTNHDTTAIVSLLNLKSMFMHTYRLFKHDTTSLDTSINIQLSTLKITESNPKFERLSIPLYDNISQYYLNNKDYDKAIAYGNKGAATALKYDQQRSLTYSYSWLGEAWFFKGDTKQGLDYLNKALQITRTKNEPFREMEIYGHLYECYYAIKDYKTAINLINRSHKMRDSLQALNNEKQVNELQIKYESAQKDKEIAVKDKQIVATLAGATIFIILSIIIYLRYRKQRVDTHLIKQSNVQKDKALNDIAYIQAHELRKPLASILGLVNLIKAMDYEIDHECIDKLEQASNQLDSKIRAVIDSADKKK